MGDNGAGRPAARAIVPFDQGENAFSIAKLTAPRSEGTPPPTTRPVEGDWASLATAPTLMLTPTESDDSDDAASTSRIATPPATMLEEQPWFKTGATVPPPSMRPMGESLAPPAVHSPNPRVFKVVAGVFAACLLIVAVAGLKILYKRFHAPAAEHAASAGSTSRTVVATVDFAHPSLSAPEIARPAELPPTAPESAARAVAATVPQVQAEAPRRTTPARSSPSPGRVTTKTTTRRAPTPKKTGRGTH